LEVLAYQSPLSLLFQKTPGSLQGLIQRLEAELRAEPGVDLNLIMERNREEPWRMAAYLMRAKILLAFDSPESKAAYRQPDELDADLEVFATSLREVQAGPMVEEFIVPFRRRLQAFGFHSATLDIRQNSAFHEKALEQLLAKAGLLDGRNFSEWTAAEKRELLERELQSPRPLFAPRYLRRSRG
jgi:phosphoenolpyruvate carboxylase